MSNWWEAAPTAQEYAQGQGAPSPGPAPAGQGANWWDDTPTPEQYVRASSSQPRAVGDTAERSAGFIDTMRASLAPDVEDQMDRLSVSMGIPRNRFGVIDGNIVYADAQGNYQRVTPSVTGSSGAVDAFKRTGRFVASQIGPSIPGLAAAGVTAFTANPLAAGGAAATADVGRQALDRAMAGQPVTDIDLTNAALHGVLNAGAATAGNLVTRAINRNPLNVSQAERDLATDPAVIASAQALQEEGQRRGVTLTPGEATNLDSLLANERALRTTPQGGPLSRMIRERNESAIPAAIRAEVGSQPAIAPTVTLARNTAQSIIDGLATARTAQSSPFYEEAFTSGTMPDVKPVLQLIDTQRAQVRTGTAAAKELDRARALLADVDKNGGTVPLSDYRQLHSVKETIDARIEDIADVGTSEEKRALTSLKAVQSRLTTILKAAHPKYAEGARVYSAMSGPIDEAKTGPLGTLIRQSSIERGPALDALFSASQTNPQATAAARRLFVQAGKSAEWDQAFAAWLEYRLQEALKPTRSGRPGNVAGSFFQSVWGGDSGPQRAITLAATGGQGPARVQGMTQMLRVMEAAARSMPEGSPTAPNIQIVANFRQKAGTFYRALLGALSPQEIGTRAGNAMGERAAENAMRDMVQAVMRPDSLKALQELRLLNPRSERALRITSQILANAGVSATGANEPSDRQPGSQAVMQTNGEAQ